VDSKLDTSRALGQAAIVPPPTVMATRLTAGLYGDLPVVQLELLLYVTRGYHARRPPLHRRASGAATRPILRDHPADACSTGSSDSGALQLRPRSRSGFNRSNFRRSGLLDLLTSTLGVFARCRVMRSVVRRVGRRALIYRATLRTWSHLVCPPPPPAPRHGRRLSVGATWTSRCLRPLR
jgi:hypothetical protein